MEKKHSQLYLKLFWTYITIAVLMISVLVTFFIYVLKKNTLKQNLEEREYITENTVEYIKETEEKVNYLYQDLYRSSSELEDLLAYFRLRPEEYKSWSLDQYSISESLVDKGIYNFIAKAFEEYKDLERIDLIGYQDFRMTQCYPDNIFYPGKYGKEQVEDFWEGGYGKKGELVYIREVRNPNTMTQEGCLIFTFEGNEIFKKIRQSSKCTGLEVCFKGQEVIFEEGEKKDASMKKEVVGEYEVRTFLNEKVASHLEPFSFFLILSVAALVMIGGILFIVRYVKCLVNRVDAILNVMNEVAMGNLQVRVDIKDYKDEIDMLANHFNNMCEKLNLYINKIYLAEIEKKNAQMQALQSQINPHFLYNTLEAIRMKAICNGDREVGKMLYSMVTLFRSQLKETDIITLGQELDYCKQYMELFKYRYMGIFKSEICCEPELLSVPVIKFILQPILENYFMHGIDRERKDNYVKIGARKEGKILTLFVQDNGYGMTQGEIEEKNKQLKENVKEQDKKISIGLNNVNRRIKAVYGEEYGISIKAVQPQGVLIKVTIEIEERDIHEKSHDSGR